MACVSGSYHTITLSDDGTAYSFGRNREGALGLGHNQSEIFFPPNAFITNYS